MQGFEVDGVAAVVRRRQRVPSLHTLPMCCLSAQGAPAEGPGAEYVCPQQQHQFSTYVVRKGRCVVVRAEELLASFDEVEDADLPVVCIVGGSLLQLRGGVANPGCGEAMCLL